MYGNYGQYADDCGDCKDRMISDAIYADEGDGAFGCGIKYANKGCNFEELSGVLKQPVSDQQ